ncbi:hypothetical protein J18TS1_11880 [Oceanobacillus oncorhynchi subsp. incaldanensis]|uniref:hypothetical protein n=1 Tax=Oceanobacillus oncorhynchi TaxID=545501 RepID=UPI001B256D3A|nr:hypothetical protein [Oceanobacillus oncorhynchi]GIO18088.1 hypothetical protein J18TS1_11880 [Oceanobacillus oncorhynchi subsp. incaldanensis]
MEEPEQKRSQAYVEIIGDTVVGKDLIMTISISVVLSFLGFFAGRELIFPRIAPEEMILSYSLLSGIAGSVTGLLVNTFLFKPKRTLNETASTNAELSEIYEKLQLDMKEERDSILNDPVTVAEMKEQGFYEMFISDEKTQSDEKEIVERGE